MHKLMVEMGVLSINQASEWGDTIVLLENIEQLLHSVLIHHGKNNSNSPNCDPTVHPTVSNYFSNKEINDKISKQ